MNIQFLDKLDSRLTEAFCQLAKDDIVLIKALEKSSDLISFCNSLLAAVICLKDRENQVSDKLVTFLKTQPDLSEQLIQKAEKEANMSQVKK